MLATVTSKTGISIRLTDERWAHIAEEHCELAGLRRQVLECVAEPARVYAGSTGELLAIREIEVGKRLVAVCRELGKDGFIITAVVTRRVCPIERRKQLWPQPKFRIT